MFYAQINDDGICFAVSQLTDPVDAPNMLPLDTYDTRLLGKRYESGEWLDVPEPEPESKE